ncbi:hypothetical protein K8R62_00035 [bacterium]|nr:hypothetical protein [bacterium]
MIHFTKYGEKKFNILNKHKVYFTKEIIEDVIKSPTKKGKKGKYVFMEKDGCRVVCNKEKDIIKVLTFYPVK